MMCLRLLSGCLVENSSLIRQTKVEKLCVDVNRNLSKFKYPLAISFKDQEQQSTKQSMRLIKFETSINKQ